VKVVACGGKWKKLTSRSCDFGIFIAKATGVNNVVLHFDIAGKGWESTSTVNGN
jgi:hypothetical protein